MTEHAVVIAGGGPAGMMLAAELALAKVDVAVVERRPNHVLVGSRAGGLHSRTIEVLDQRGVADRFLAEGQVAQVGAMLATAVLDMSDFPTRHPYSLGIWQNQIERIMAAWIAELPVRIYYGCEVTDFAQDDTGVDVELSDDQSLRAQYLVGCDGGRSVIRRAAGIEFPGWDPTRSNLIAEVETTEEPPRGLRHDATGVHALNTMEDGRTVRVVTTEQQLGPDGEPTLRDLSEALITVYGTDFGIHNPTVDLQVHRHDTSGSGLPRGTSPTRRRLGARALPGGWTGPPDRCAGCGESGMEAGSGGQRDLPGEPPGYVSGRAPPGRCPRDPAHDGSDRAPTPGRAHPASGRSRVGAGEHGRASQTARRDHLRAGHSLRPQRGTSAARTPDARSGPRDRRRPAPRLRAAARCPAYMLIGQAGALRS